MSTDRLSECLAKMRARACSEAAMKSFAYNYRQLIEQRSPHLREADLEPVAHLPTFAEVEGLTPDPALLAQTVVLKLNGGLGTSMGLAGPKSLLPVKEGWTFLDFILRQHLHQQRHAPGLRLLLMNSFATSDETRGFLLARYPELGPTEAWELMQNEVPKLALPGYGPATYAADPTREWCPPGHGDIYAALLGSGRLAALLAQGIRYAFVSNADNLGAVLDARLLTWFARQDVPFLMEVCERTAADRKGGHLARRGGRLLLREVAQAHPDDLAQFQDVTRHRCFNTNNLWLRLDRLAELLREQDGFLPLPLIQNQKPVNPAEKTSPPVLQLETAMGAAIECFADAAAMLVPRARFAPVKNVSDLLVVRSDAYVRHAEDGRLLLAAGCAAPPEVVLDGEHCKNLKQLENLVPEAPSLVGCQRLEVVGAVRLGAANTFRGQVVVRAASGPVALPPGTYADTTVTL